MKRRVAQFDSEAAMCARFIDLATGMDTNGARRRVEGWTAYPETGGFDILLVRHDGFQIGVEAKLRLNDDVILQVMESRHSVCSPGPDCRAVLVPCGTGSRLHHEVCARLGITVITVRDGLADDSRFYAQFTPELPYTDSYDNPNWPEYLPTKRIELPEFVPDVAAGSKSPLQLSAWKIKAIKIACILERRGWLCRQDFKHIQIDHRRFLECRWITIVDGVWRRGTHWPDFRRQHPRNFDEIDAKWDAWKPPELPLEQQQSFGRLL